MTEPVASRTEETEPSETLPRQVAMIAFMVACVLAYAAMMLADPVAGGDALTPSTLVIQAFGGVNFRLMVQEGEWFRLVTHAFLHIGLIHLAANLLGFLIGGRLLEPLLGARAFAAVFFLSAAAGGAASVFFNPPGITGAGASGGLMGLFGFALAFALRVPRGEYRSFLTRQSLSVLIPTALPAFIPFLSLPIDHAAHAGGAVAGAALALLSRLYWPVLPDPRRLRALATGVLILAAAMLVWAARDLIADWPEMVMQARLIPQDEVPRTDAAFRERAAALAERYPFDPRARFNLSVRLARQGALDRAETEARTAMETAERFPRIFLPAFRQQSRLYLAMIQQDRGRQANAMTTAAPLCGLDMQQGLRTALDQSKLCEKR